jgi:hypothetical protein
VDRQKYGNVNSQMDKYTGRFLLSNLLLTPKFMYWLENYASGMQLGISEIDFFQLSPSPSLKLF